MEAKINRAENPKKMVCFEMNARLIPAGTGCRAYSGIRIEEPEAEEPEQREEQAPVAAE